MKKYILSLLFFTVLQSVFAQSGGIKGYIRNLDGEGLPLATIYVKNSQLGTASNLNAYFELKLPEGKHEIIFQYVGYQTLTKTVEVGTTMQSLDIKLDLQTYMLKELEVRAGAEDPAYTIMRKAVAMSKIHKLQVDQYEARIYMKGTTRVLNIPWIVKGKLKKEGVEEGKTYITETLTELKFEQPNKYTSSVKAIRSSEIDKNSVSPMSYIQASFYDPQIGTTVSPLSPSAFGYYKFHLESVFRDQNYEVNKIKVTPRSKGDDLWEGFIYIVEDKWCIHSLQLKTEKLGVHIDIKQVYSPVEKDVFMPINHQFKISGSYLGFEANFNYVATVSNYKVKLNPNFIPEVKLIDEKIEKEKAAQLNKVNEPKIKKGEQDLETALLEGKELTRKNLKKLLKENEKRQLEEERKKTKQGETPPSELVRNTQTNIDSVAKKLGQDSLFWEQNRGIALANDEVLSYQKKDSLLKIDSVQKKLQVKDSTLTEKIQTKKFKIADILMGGEYKTGKKSTFKWFSPLERIHYNTVEGWSSEAQLSYWQGIKKQSFRLTATGRYAFARQKFTGKSELEWNFFRKNPLDTLQFFRGKIQLDGGRYIQQFNQEYPIPIILNDLANLYFERNFANFYEKDYLRLRYQQEIRKGFDVKASLEYAKRYSLQDHTNWTIIDWQKRDFTQNLPLNLENMNEKTHNALTFEANIAYKPFLKYAMYNGRRYVANEGSTLLKFQYRKGLMDSDFDFLSLGIQDELKVGIRANLGYAVSVGTFLNQNKVYFPDYKHFNANQIFIQFADPVSSFRLMDYYKYSTAQSYVEGHAYIQLRKFVLTQNIYLRSFGWKENIFVNQLFTPQTSYSEIGYTLDGILRFFRIEAISSFENGAYKDWGIRVGLTTTFGLKISSE